MSNSSVFLPLFVVFPFVQFFFFESSRFGNFLMLMKKDRRLRSFIRVLFQEITFLYVQFERIKSIGTMQNWYFVDCVFVVILMECLRAVAGFVLRMLFSSGRSPICLWNSCWIFPVQCILSRDFLLSRKFCLDM